MTKQKTFGFVLIAMAGLLMGCGESDTPVTTVDTVESNEPAAKEDITFVSPIRLKDWEIGDPKHINTVLELYKSWDEEHIDQVADHFADTVELRIPTERDNIVLPHSKIAAALRDNMTQYRSTETEFVSVLSVHEKSIDQDWVMVTAFSKWVEKNGKRDSLIYHDDWKLTNGKVDLLISYQKLPVKHFLHGNLRQFLDENK